MECEIRPFEDRDLDAMLDCWEASSRLAHPFLSDEFIEQERRNIPEIYMPIAETWIAENNDEIVGFVALIGSEVGAIFVHPQHHRQGAGWALMEKAKALRGDLEVEVFKENAIGRRFYDKYGFETISEKIHEPTGNAILRMRYTAPTEPQ